MVTKYHYSVHIFPKTQDFSIWVGVTISQPYAGDSTSFVEEDSEGNTFEAPIIDDLTDVLIDAVEVLEGNFGDAVSELPDYDAWARQ